MEIITPWWDTSNFRLVIGHDSSLSPDHEASNVSIKVDIKPSRSSSGKMAGQHSGSRKADGTADERIHSREPTKDDILETPGSHSPVKVGSGKKIYL